MENDLPLTVEQQNHLRQRLANCWMQMLPNPNSATQEKFERYYEAWLHNPLFGTDNNRKVIDIMHDGDMHLIEQWLHRLENPGGLGSIRD